MPPTATRKRPASRALTSTDNVIDGDDIEILPAPVEFTVTFQRDDEDEPHTFKARPKMTYKRMMEAAKAQRGGGIDALGVFESMIRRALVDTDGVPVKWEPEFEGTGKDRRLIGPDGELRPVKDLVDLQAVEAGSSKRRWLHYMDRDDELEVELDEITAAYEVLVEATSDRPT